MLLPLKNVQKQTMYFILYPGGSSPVSSLKEPHVISRQLIDIGSLLHQGIDSVEVKNGSSVVAVSTQAETSDLVFEVTGCPGFFLPVVSTTHKELPFPSKSLNWELPRAPPLASREGLDHTAAPPAGRLPGSLCPERRGPAKRGRARSHLRRKERIV